MHHRISQSALAAALVLIALAATATAASAKPGDLDQGFGEGGRAASSAPLPEWRDARTRVAAMPDGSDVLAGEQLLLRYGPEGLLDPAFGAGGRLPLPEIEGMRLTISDVAVDPSGRIVVFGTALDLSRTDYIPFYYVGAYVHPSYAVVMRLTSSGQLDPSFGSGRGFVRSTLGLTPNLFVEEALPTGFVPTQELTEVRGVSGTVDALGRPILLASQGYLKPNEHGDELKYETNVIARMTPSGELDGSFGVNGVARIGTQNDQVPALELGGDGSEALLVLTSRIGTELPSRLDELDSTGRPNTAFAKNGGRSDLAPSADIAIDGSGRILVLSAAPGDNIAGHERTSTVMRLTANGKIERGFGDRGSARLVSPKHQGTVAYGSLVVDAGGRALAVGSARIGKSGKAGRKLIVERLTSAGKPDPAFGHGGWVTTGFGAKTRVAAPHRVEASEEYGGNYVTGPNGAPLDSGAQLAGPDAAIDSGGRLVVADSAGSPALQPGGFVLGRYRLGK